MCNAANQRAVPGFADRPEGRRGPRPHHSPSTSSHLFVCRGINIENPFSVPPDGRQAAVHVDGASDMPRI